MNLRILAADLFIQENDDLKLLEFIEEPKDINEPNDRAYQLRKAYCSLIVVRLLRMNQHGKVENEFVHFPFRLHNKLDI